MSNHSTFFNNRQVAFVIAIRSANYSRPWCGTASRRAWVGGASFAVDASLIAADVNKQRSVAGTDAATGKCSRRYADLSASISTRWMRLPEYGDQDGA